MIMEILTGVGGGGGGDSVLFARNTGVGDSVLVNKKKWGDSVQGGILSYTRVTSLNIILLNFFFYLQLAFFLIYNLLKKF